MPSSSPTRPPAPAPRKPKPRRRALIPALLASLALAPSAPAQNSPAQNTPDQPQPTTPYTLHVENDLVLTDVVVRDKKTGQPVTGLTKNDFTILENGKPQSILTFDYEDIDRAAPLNEATVSGSSGRLLLARPAPGRPLSPEQFRGHRLVVLFFDLTSMQPEDIERSVAAARNFIQHQMSPADLVSIVSLDTTLSVDQDFTTDKPRLIAALAQYNGTQPAGFQQGFTSTSNQVEDATSYTPDESEYNDINTDRELFAIASISRSLAWMNQKKALLYFSGGLERDGIENQASLRAAINAAVRSNLSIYSVDTRGLQAIAPVGDASTGSLRGTAAYTGGAVQNNFDANFNTQEVLSTLATDTGGRFYGDSNDFAPAFTRMQRDTSQYYVLGFRSTNPLRDGRYRKLSIKINRPGFDNRELKLEYRPGYYAPADYRHSNREGREQQLEDQLRSDLPATDVAVYLAAYYFRISPPNGPARYDLPIDLIVPGSQIPFTQNRDRDKATLDIIGQVTDAANHPIGDIRQTVKLAIDQAQRVRQKNIQYSTSFTLPPGLYHLKFVVRENETGRMGSFESEVNIPDLAKSPVRLSSVVLASQRQPAPKASSKSAPDPLVENGLLWIPNIAHVFRPDQHLYLLYELYDPSTHPAELSAATSASPRLTAAESAPARDRRAEHSVPPHVLTSIEFLSGGAKVFETPLVEATRITEPGRDAIAFQFDLPLASLKPGSYICQVNVIDDNAGAFTFPRTAILIR